MNQMKTLKLKNMITKIKKWMDSTSEQDKRKETVNYKIEQQKLLSVNKEKIALTKMNRASRTCGL